MTATIVSAFFSSLVTNAIWIIRLRRGRTIATVAHINYSVAASSREMAKNVGRYMHMR